MNDTIHIGADRLTAGIAQFVASSALANCTTTVAQPDGSIAVTSSWPVAAFSGGEVVAWSILRSLVSGDLRRLVERCDTDSIGALIGCLALVHNDLVAA